MSIPFDTLAYAKKLEARGVEPKQAEAHAEVLAEVLETSFISKNDAHLTHNDYQLELANFRSETQVNFAEIRKEIAELKSELKTEIADVRSELKSDIASFKSDIIKWVLGISFAQAALLVSALKFLH